MKKVVLHALCVLSLFAGIPAQGMYDRVKSYMPRIPKMSMPSVDYKTALQRFNASKERFESALNANKKALIAAAAAALIASVAALMRARRRAESRAQGETLIPESAAPGEDSSEEGVEEVEELSVQSETPLAPVGGIYGAYGAMLGAGSGVETGSVGSGRSTGSSSMRVPSRYRGYYSE